MLLEYDDNLDTTRSTELSIFQVIVFPFWANCGVSPLSTHMSIRVLSKAYEAIESMAFHRIIALLRTDRDHEQKLVLTRLFALSPGRCKSNMGFLDLLKVSIVSELNSPCSALCIEAPECTVNTRASVWLELAYSLAKFHAAVLSQSSSCGPRWLSLRSGRARISLMRFTFVDNSSRLPFCLPNSILYKVHPENFICVPPKRSIPIFQLSVE